MLICQKQELTDVCMCLSLSFCASIILYIFHFSACELKAILDIRESFWKAVKVPLGCQIFLCGCLHSKAPHFWLYWLWHEQKNSLVCTWFALIERFKRFSRKIKIIPLFDIFDMMFIWFLKAKVVLFEKYVFNCTW